jgi:hypothetical protein
MGPRIGPSFAKSLFQPSHENGVVIMVTRLEPSWSHVYSCKFCIHLRCLTVRRFGIVDATGLKSYDVEVIFNGMTSLPNFLKIYLQSLLVGDKQKDNMVIA